MLTQSCVTNRHTKLCHRVTTAGRPDRDRKSMVRFLSAAELQPDPDENADPNAGLSEDRVFELRGAHVLFFDGDEGCGE